MGKRKLAAIVAVSALVLVALITVYTVLMKDQKIKLSPELQSAAASKGTFQVGLFYRTAGVTTPPIDVVCIITVDTLPKTVSMGGGSGCDNDKAEFFAIQNGTIATVGIYDEPCSGDLHDDDFYEYRITQSPLNHEYMYGFFDGNASPGIPGMKPVASKYKNGLTGKVSCIKIYP